MSAFGTGWSEFRDTGQGPVIGKTLELQARTKHRGVIPVELSVSSANLQGSWHAIGILRELFAGREVIGIDCLDLVEEGGTLHCISMQQPL